MTYPHEDLVGNILVCYVESSFTELFNEWMNGNCLAVCGWI
jgi:hypothetical protein